MTRQREKGCVAWVSMEVSYSGPQPGNFIQRGIQVRAPKNEVLAPPTCLPRRSLIIPGFFNDPGAPVLSQAASWSGLGPRRPSQLWNSHAGLGRISFPMGSCSNVSNFSSILLWQRTEHPSGKKGLTVLSPQRGPEPS